MPKYTKRILCRITVEAVTPLAVGSGRDSIMTDSTVVLDVNGMPYIPATSIAGVIRHAIPRNLAQAIMGSHEEVLGSRVIFSEAKILDSKGEVMDGYQPEVFNDPLLAYYKNLPIRQHVRINGRGTAEKHGKFDNQVVYKGTRFCFEVEFLVEDESAVSQVLDVVQSDTFRLGGGVHKGYGEIQVVELKKVSLDLSKELDLKDYLAKSSNLKESASWPRWMEINKETHTNMNTYVLTLQPMDFFMFGSGLGDNDVDMTPVLESMVEWNDGVGKMSKQLTLIPASSIKGALRHRTAYYYNLSIGRFIGDDSTQEENKAEVALFGQEKDGSTTPGVIVFGDVIEKELEWKIINHVSVDRFTGGAIDGSLFDEKPLFGAGKDFALKIKMPVGIQEEYVAAFERALHDICDGLLPLGGGVNRGNGIFVGSYIKMNGED